MNIKRVTMFTMGRLIIARIMIYAHHFSDWQSLTASRFDWSRTCSAFCVHDGDRGMCTWAPLVGLISYLSLKPYRKNNLDMGVVYNQNVLQSQMVSIDACCFYTLRRQEPVWLLERSVSF